MRCGSYTQYEEDKRRDAKNEGQGRESVWAFTVEYANLLEVCILDLNGMYS